VAGISVAGASVAAGVPPPQAARIMLASTTSESRMFKLRFMFLLRENVFEINKQTAWKQDIFSGNLLVKELKNYTTKHVANSITPAD
jgi:hypothetical protein